MSNKKSKRLTAIGIVAAAVSFAVLATQANPSFASNVGAQLFAQANDTPAGKPNNDAGNPNSQVPNNQPGNPAPTGTQPNEPAAVILKNSIESGVPARCASVADASERQKCMNTPKGQ